MLFRVTNNLDIGGIQKRLASLLPCLTQKFEVHVVAYRQRGTFAKELEQAGVHVHLHPIKGKTHIPSIFKLSRLFKKHNAAIVHTHSLGANIPGILAAVLAQVPVRIAQVHRKNLHWYASSVFQRKKQILIETWTHKLFTDKILFVSQESLAYFKQQTKLPENKLHVLHNGFEFPVNQPLKDKARQIQGLPKDKKIIAFVGRLSKGKGLDYFLDFAQKALFEDSSLYFLIIGEGPSRQESEQEIFAQGLNNNIRFVGEQTDMNTWYPALDLVLFTSEPWAEGMPGVVLEACAHGLPILARFSNPIKEIKSYYSNIHFIEESIGPTDNIEKALHPSTKADLERFKKEFGLEQMTTRTIHLYRSLLQMNKGLNLNEHIPK